jgi:tetratricopeptide (TPR) repeat protein
MFGWGLGGLGCGLGYGLGYGGYGDYGGYGLSSWMYGPSLYDWGYSTYYNPYSSYGYAGSYAPTAVGVQQPVYDYGLPLNTQAPTPDPAVASLTLTSFDAARAAFKAGDYPRALAATDEAIRQMPNDAALHEFRALVLFAMGRYDEAAATLYAVLTAGPGWDWATMSGLYPSVSVYTQQLRALENYCTVNPASAPARFVLAYHYLTAGYTLAALQQLQQVALLQPRDTLAPQLAGQIDPAAAAPAPGRAAAAAPVPLPATAVPAAAPSPGGDGQLVGTWTAQADPETTITLSFRDPGQFIWTVTHQGQSHQLQGKLTYGNGILTLAQDHGAAMVGQVTWNDATHFTFKVPGAGPGDPGLSFTKAP